MGCGSSNVTNVSRVADDIDHCPMSLSFFDLLGKEALTSPAFQ